MKQPGCVVITGANRGLGKEIARLAWASGYSVALIGRKKADLDHLQMELSKTAVPNQKVSAHRVDLVSASDVRKAFKSIRSAHRHIVALVNNAGTWMGSKSIRETSLDEFQESLNLNFFTALNATKALLDGRSKASGCVSIVNIGATASLQGWDGVAAFCLAKGALRSFSQALAREEAKNGVHVSHLVLDGLIDNERTRKLNPKTANKKFMSPVSIAKSVLELIEQDPSAWTFEKDLRPYCENW